MMGKSYKQMKAFDRVENKRGQVAIFVIIAIIAIGALVVLFVLPRLSVTSGDSDDPNAFISSCIEPQLKSNLAIIMEQGGYYDPTHYVTFEDQKIQYLCYISGNYKPCIVQQPLLVAYVENTLNDLTNEKARECISLMRQEYERRGYQITSSPSNVNVSLVPGKIKINFNSPVTLSRDGTEAYRTFSSDIPSEVYNLLTTAISIVGSESTFGDSEITLYLQFYPDLKIEKIKKGADTIYRITNVISEERFTFAVRSLVWPQGYGLGGNV